MANSNLPLQHLQQALTEHHGDIRQWHLLHQECLLLGLDAQSLQSFTAFSDILTLHINFENEHLLYQAAAVNGDTLRFGLLVYQKEHDKILQLLDKLHTDVQDYLNATGRVKRLLLLDLLEKHFRLAGVLDHHEQREESDLFLHINHLPLQQQWLETYAPLENKLLAFKQQLKQQLKTA